VRKEQVDPHMLETNLRALYQKDGFKQMQTVNEALRMCAVCARQTTQKKHSLQFLLEDANEDQCTCIVKNVSNIFKPSMFSNPEWQNSMDVEKKLMQSVPSFKQLNSIMEPKIVANQISLFGMEQEHVDKMQNHPSVGQ
jgi:hypothetical protein